MLLRAREQDALRRMAAETGAGLEGMRSSEPRLSGSHTSDSGTPAVQWRAVGPRQTASTTFGLVTGRVSSIAIDSNDTAGNTVYAGTTGGGVWKSKNAAGSAGSVTFTPLTDNLPVFTSGSLASLSIGAISVQPGGTGVVLAGTGDVNDAIDSYWGTGILRSQDNGATWSLITQSSDATNGNGQRNFSFLGLGFAGFAWSTANPALVVAAVSSSLEGDVTGANLVSEGAQGLYYSTDSGASWSLATITDGPGRAVQNESSPYSDYGGNAVTAVVWNPLRHQFFAAVRFHGVYSSPDGVTWTRILGQPGTGLTQGSCPARPDLPGSPACPMGRGALAVNSATGDTFAFYVDQDNYDQGIWQDICGGAGGACTNPVSFAAPIPSDALEDSEGLGTIPLGTYNLWLAAVPVPGDTLLFAGTEDIFRCGIAGGCQWRNTTNTQTCASAQVAPAQHAVDFLASPPGTGVPLMYFGNDSGLWRSKDGVDQHQAECLADDASHFDNLNGALGSLGEMVSVASDPVDATILLGGAGANGTGASTTSAMADGTVAWPQVSSGEGGFAAIDPVNRANWYVSDGPGVNIAQCTAGSGCTSTEFASAAGIGETQVARDEALLDAPFLLDPVNPANVILGTCRVWRGPASGGSDWPVGTQQNAISTMLDGYQLASCNGNTPIRSLAAGGPAGAALNSSVATGSSVIYAGMAGLEYGGAAAGHILRTADANNAYGSTPWQDLYLSPAINDSQYQKQFNPGAFDISSLYVDPHDATGNTVYATVMGFNTPHLYWSTDGGQSWLDVSSNLPDAPANAVVVDPGNARMIYVALDIGVYVTGDVRLCGNQNCWSGYGSGLPNAPVVGLSLFTYGSTRVLRAATYGRGVWQTPLAGPPPSTTLSLAPELLTFAGQGVGSSSAAQAVQVTNSGSSGNSLQISDVAATGDFTATSDCIGSELTAGKGCTVQVTFTPTGTGARPGILTISANVSGGQQTVSLSGTGLPGANIVLDPVALSFAPSLVGVASAAQNVTISNTGASETALTSVAATGDFTVTANTCAAALPAATGCTVSIVCTPSAPGVLTGVLTVTDGQGTQTAQLTGTGQAAATDVLSPVTLSFAPQVEGTLSSAQAVTLTNSGDVALSAIALKVSNPDFGVVNNCGNSLNGHASCTFLVSFTPHGRGAESGVLTVTDLIHVQTVLLSGSGLAPPTDTLQPSSLTFAAQASGTIGPPQSITMTNSGDVPLAGIQIAINNADYSQTNNCGMQLPAQSGCAISVTFTPHTSGTDLGTLIVTDAMRTQSVPLTGAALTQDVLSPTSLVFAAQPVGTTSAAQTVMFTNQGTGALTGVRIAIAAGGPAFAETTTCGENLAAGTGCAISITFTPQGAGAANGTLTVTDALHTQTVALSGTGQAGGKLSVTPLALDFGSSGVGIATAPQRVTVTNTGAAPIEGLTITASGAAAQADYLFSLECGSTLAAGASCSIAITFDPVAPGQGSGALTIASVNGGSQTVTLNGTGVLADFSLAVTSAQSVTVSSGQAATYTLSLTPASSMNETANIGCSATPAPPHSSCVVSPATAPLHGVTTLTVTAQTGAAEATAVLPARRGWPWTALALALPLGVVGWPRRPGTQRYILLLALLAVASIGCGSHGIVNGVVVGSSVTPAGTYTYTVTATAQGLTRSVALTLIVK